MDLADSFNAIPFAELLGIEVTAAADGHAEGTVALTEELSSVPGGAVAHGGVAFALADTVGGAAIFSAAETVCPTIDMRIDYVSPATDDLFAEADVLDLGDAVGVADVTVRRADDRLVATARGVYKTGGDAEGTPWTAGRDRAAGDQAPRRSR